MTRVDSGLDPAAIAEGARILRGGGLVAFATETVYGLGADARSEAAVRRIYEAKGRPGHNPLIVHVLGAADARLWTEGWDARAERLSAALWPGPITFILGRNSSIPELVSGGGQTLAVRAPRSPVARALLEAFGGPIAAPSANRSTSISPTQASHVLAELAGRVPLILDGGPCELGLESTVLDLSGPNPRVLRPGSIAASAIEAILDEPVERANAPSAPTGAPLASPGLLERHYAPRTPTVVLERSALSPRQDTAFLVFSPLPGPHVRVLPAEPEACARELYAALRWADAQGAARIAVEAPPPGEAWEAIRDRLRRASAR